VRLGALLVLAAMSGGCGIALRRDLAAVPPQSVIYDDMCGVQQYHDAIEIGQTKGPKVLRSTDLEKVGGDRPVGGMATFSFEDDAALTELRKVLSENWDRLPPALLNASRVEVEVQWAEKAGVRRVVTTRDAQISDGRVTYYLPYHVCLSELLYGAPLYKTRRELLGLATPAAPAAPPPTSDLPAAAPALP
jgi:hypothetical protein